MQDIFKDKETKSKMIGIKVTPTELRQIRENNISPQKLFRNGLKSTLREMSLSGIGKSKIDISLNKLYDAQDQRRKKRKEKRK